MDRRSFLKSTAAAALATQLGTPLAAGALPAGERPVKAHGVEVLNPCGRVPMSLIIDDSTCLVNMAHFGIPQFAEVFPDNYKQDWRALPREIPDDFVREFGNWCGEHGVKGKYSIVPYPAMVGWVDRVLPGWTKRELDDSLKLVRELMMPNWDIHPEMVSHTRGIDTKTGRPYPEATAAFMENWGFSVGMSVDRMADYVAYGLRILKNAGLECEGMTTPGGFGSRSMESLAQGTLQACRDVYGTQIPHYFRDLYTGNESVAPLVQYASDLQTDDPKCVVSIIGCTGDWLGGWDGLERGSVDKHITEDLRGGRLPQVIARGEPAIIVCHWPGVYFNGEKVGFNIFKEVVRRLEARYDNLIWMKLCEIARYWAAKELTKIEAADGKITFTAPFAADRFTVRVKSPSSAPPTLTAAGKVISLTEVKKPLGLKAGTWHRDADSLAVCFSLAKGVTTLDTSTWRSM